MAGLLLLFIAGLWIFFAVWASVLVSRATKGRGGVVVGVLFFLAVLLFPVIDEIIGGMQYRSLCAKNAAEFHVMVQNPEGRTAKYSGEETELDWVFIPITKVSKKYSDIATGELIVELTGYTAKGGLLIRSLGISNNNSPLTIGRPSCSPEKVRGEVASRTFKFYVIN